jgi:hypothetical protein
LRGQDCVKSCDTDEYYDQEEKKCKNCNPLCSKCIDSWDHCLGCANEVLFNYNSNTHKCDPRCPSGQYFHIKGFLSELGYIFEYINFLQENDNSVDGNYRGNCETCSDNCAECIDSYDRCILCKNGYYLNKNTCVQSCPAANFIDINFANNQKVCRPCAAFCEECESEYLCKKCNPNFLLKDGDCYYKEVNLI